VANWTPDGFIGQLFKLIGKYVPPPAGINSPVLWGTERYLRELFLGHKVEASKQIFNFRYTSAEHWLNVFKSFYGPTNRAFAALDSGGQSALSTEITALLERMNRGGKNSLVVPAEYLEAVVTVR
jgi:hypothetical protein